MKRSKTDRRGDNPSDINPAAAARRRMIRALGSSGALSLASLAVNGWRKPVVRAAVLPAHAQSSVACTVGVTIEMQDFNMFPVTFVGCIGASGSNGSTDLGCVTQVFNSTAGLTDPSSTNGMFTAAPGTYTVSFLYDYNSGRPNITISCCDGPPFIDNLDDGTGSDDFILIVNDDGECSLSTFGP